MHIDGREKDLPFCYRPQCCGLWAAPHGELFYSYRAEFRQHDLAKAAEAEPALSLAAECCGVMGLFADCAEMLLLAAAVEGMEEKDRAWLREIMPRLAAAVRDREPDGKRLYFSLILPVVAAFDAGETELARELLLETVQALENSLLSPS